jgi:diaminopimelate epimerase
LRLPFAKLQGAGNGYVVIGGRVARVLDRERLRARVYERGASETLSPPAPGDRLRRGGAAPRSHR